MAETWPDPNIEWEDLWSREWAAGVVRLDRQVSKIDVTYTGNCPRCGHEIRVVVPRPVDDLLIAEDLADEEAGDEKPKPSRAADGRSSCNCGKDHKGRPDSAEPEGCGAHGHIYF